MKRQQHTIRRSLYSYKPIKVILDEDPHSLAPIFDSPLEILDTPSKILIRGIRVLS